MKGRKLEGRRCCAPYDLFARRPCFFQTSLPLSGRPLDIFEYFFPPRNRLAFTFLACRTQSAASGAENRASVVDTKSRINILNAHKIDFTS